MSTLNLSRSISREVVHDRLRTVIYKTRGQSHGPITRLMSPSDLGGILKPFVFLDLIDAHDLSRTKVDGIGLHPHSGIATLTWLLEGSVNYEDDLGRRGQIEQGWMEWMNAGMGAWHGGNFGDSDRLRGFQLWLALPSRSELGQPYSRYLAPESIGRDGPVTVLLGQHGDARGAIDAPSSVDYFSVRLQAGESWRYQPRPGHSVAWAAVSVGNLLAPQTIDAGELAVFEEGRGPIEFVAVQDTEFVFGSAAKHPHDLALGNYSVHTDPRALLAGEKRIREIGRELRAQGRI